MSSQSLVSSVSSYRPRVPATVEAASAGEEANMTLMTRVLQCEEDAQAALETYNSLIAVVASMGR